MANETEEELQAQADEAMDAEILGDFKDKKSTYPDWWNPIYEENKDHEAFTLGGEILKDQELRKYKFTNAVQPNLLLAYVNHEANTTLTNKYKATVSPNGGGSDIPKARAREDVLRGLQRNAPPVYNVARRHQLAGGIRYSIIEMDYQSRRGPAKTINYKDVDDTWNVFPTPNPLTPTFRDIQDFLVMEKVPRAQWKKKTGRDPEKDGFTRGEEKDLWQYWVKHEEMENEYLMNDGSTKLESELMGDDPELGPDLSEAAMPEPFRQVVTCTWKWYKIFEDQIIDREIWKGDKCPLVACTGMRVVDRDGKVHFYPLTKFAEDPARQFAIYANIINLRMKRSPFSRWMIPFETIDLKQLKEFRKASVLGEGDIPWKSLSEDGKTVLPEPKEIQPFLVDPTIVQLMQEQVGEIERILGISDADLGRKTNETSGIAIENRANQSNLANYHLTFNFFEYVKDLGMVVLDLFPRVLTARQQVAFVDKDDQAVMQWLNGPDGMRFNPNEEYDLVVEVMPDSATDREAEANNLKAMTDNQFIGPVMAQVPGVMAKVIKAQRGRYAEEIAQMMEAAQNDPEKAALKAQIQKLEQAMQGQSQDLKLKELALKNEQVKHSIEASKEINRHQEKMMELGKDMNADQAALWIEAFNANTARKKVDGEAQNPESLDIERAARATPA